ncbi:hypothetical protein B0A49_09285 [Cryomyces minteri]|uniref:Transcription factor domain-containing protein n=1 Tax=Cryomyces minteri TaxID=331657 RepID=A0A4U0WV06_9PEZI|nr:hypothetical protein B0A49_09285 [Cryomyces minteri]
METLRGSELQQQTRVGAAQERFDLPPHHRLEARKIDCTSITIADLCAGHNQIEQSFNSLSMSDTVSTISNTDSFMLDPSLYPNHEGDARHVTFATAGEFEPSSASSNFSMFDDTTTLQSTTTAPSSLSSGQSPRLMDLVMPGSDLTAPSTEYANFRSQHPESLYQPCQPSLIIQRNGYMDEDDDVEEVVRQTYVNPDHEAWIMRLPSPSSSGSSSGSSEGSPTVTCWNTFDTLYREPVYSNDSPEMLMLRFDRQTCGILSVKDGPTENPWRTLIWPLARDCSALYHAIASMTSFHTSREIPSMRVQGIHHMRSSIKSLVSGIQNMRFDTAIATTLVLAFAESWDQHISTGINHIKGAKILVNQALVQHRQASFSAEDTARLRFLCNTWVYMDVIARLTSVDDDESNDFDNVYEMMSPGPLENDMQLDPLMGCASTLFPVVGRVANLVRRVRKSESNSPAIISQAVDLKRMLEAWIPPSFVEPPEDPTSEIQHSLQTAEAYRWATLLYLHQAVPEVPSLSSADLSKKVLEYLATVPLSSRAIIVHIYPLLAAGAEANNEEDRRWVADRWQSMGHRMAIGVIDRCADVLKELWSRRDAYEMSGQSCLRVPVATTSFHSSMLKRNYTVDEAVVDDPFDWINSYGGGKRRAASGGDLEAPRALRLNPPRPRRSSADLMTGAIDPHFTVRGRLHWLGVMKDWGWEVLLG